MKPASVSSLRRTIAAESLVERAPRDGLGPRFGTYTGPGATGRRVLLHVGAAAFQSPGGGETQVVKTAEYLRRRGLRAKLFLPLRDRIADADCLHLFGTLPEHLALVEAARHARTPTVLSTISWYDLSSAWHLTPQVHFRLARAARFFLRALIPSLPNWRRRLYAEADRLLPNSLAEAHQLVRYFGVSPEKICVVPNGADPAFAEGDPAAFARRFGLRDFLLYPGRIEPRKNQLGFLRAARNLDVPIVMLGAPVPGHEDYLQACRHSAGDNVCFVGRLEHDSPLLRSAYAAARCVALVSWFETPGLAALEAAFSGTPLVLTSRGATREYFGPLAHYAHPNRPREIRRAVEAALNEPRSDARARWVRERYAWDEVALATAKAYETIL